MAQPGARGVAVCVCARKRVCDGSLFSRNGEPPFPTPAPRLSPLQQVCGTCHGQRIFSACRHRCDGKRHGQKVPCISVRTAVRPPKWSSGATFRAQEISPQRICRPLGIETKPKCKDFGSVVLEGSRE